MDSTFGQLIFLKDVGSCPGSKGMETVARGAIYVREKSEVIAALCLIYEAAAGQVYNSWNGRK